MILICDLPETQNLIHVWCSITQNIEALMIFKLDALCCMMYSKALVEMHSDTSRSVGRFTGQLTASDPLQTLFQLLSGRIPTVATVNIGVENSQVTTLNTFY